MTKERFAKIGEACRAAKARGRVSESGRQAGEQGIAAGGSGRCITNR